MILLCFLWRDLVVVWCLGVLWGVWPISEFLVTVIYVVEETACLYYELYFSAGVEGASLLFYLPSLMHLVA
jgi:hypothetical protein